MASYHCTANIGGAGASAAHADYIGRDGKHKKKPGEDDLEAAGHGNLPSWAVDAPRAFWEAADEYERANGSTYRELVVALPRELTALQRYELVEDFIRQELGDKHAFQWSIHNPKASLEGGEQPHAHIMYSERILDGIERPAEQFFKRYNSKNPERGGCKKASGGKTKDENVAALLVTRERWATVQNEHLARHDHAARVDHRSLKNQGIDREPERHLGQAQIQTQSAAVDRVMAARADRTLAATLKTAIDAAQRRLVRLQALSRAFVDKVTGRTAQPPSVDRVDELADFIKLFSEERARTINQGRRLEASQQDVSERETARAASLKREIEGMQPPGLFASKSTRQQFEERLAGLRRDGQAALDADHAARKALALGRAMQSGPDVYVLAAIKRDHPGLVERMQPLSRDPHLVELANQRLVERAKAVVSERTLDANLSAFSTHASNRETKANGYGDRGARWEALPAPLQKMIEDFNQVPKAQRPAALGRMRQSMLQDLGMAEKLAEQLGQAKKQTRGLSR